jgi:outer membrane murein-binding lipoprotein Lpp
MSHSNRVTAKVAAVLALLLFVVVGQSSAGPEDSLAARVTDLEALVGELQDKVDAFEDQGSRIEAVEDLLAHFSRSGDEIFITGANLHVVNGLGDTETTNALGNVIIGYNEERVSGNDRTGSHMLVVGRWLNYTRYGGIVVGIHSTTSNNYASVCGGYGNEASGPYAAVSGGYLNVAGSTVAAVSGGGSNVVSGFGAAVSGGYQNEVSGPYASVSGGRSNGAGGAYASVGGGFQNEASGDFATVSGGVGNTADDNDEHVP